MSDAAKEALSRLRDALREERRAMAADLEEAREKLEGEGFTYSGLTMKSREDKGGYHYVGQIWTRPGQGAILHFLKAGSGISVDILYGSPHRKTWRDGDPDA